MESIVFAGAAPWIQATEGSGYGLFRLGPDRAAWEPLRHGLPENVEVRSLALDPAHPATVYAGTQAGPYRSTDAGETWEDLGFPEPQVVWSVLVHPADPRVLYVGTEAMGIYRSDDGGASWRRLAVGAPTGLVEMGFPTRVIRVAVDPCDADAVYAALEVGGLVRSLDGGATWADCNAGLLALARHDRYKSRIGSDTDTEGMLDSHALAVSPARPGTVFLANRMGMFRSPDRGETWEDMKIGRFSPITYARDVKVSRHDPQVMHAALSVAADSKAGALVRSQDLGASWQRFDHDVDIASTLMIIAESPTAPERVWCGARRGQVLGTDDGGNTWTERPLPAGVQGIYALACT